MNIQQQIDAAGLVPVLRNAAAEKCAQDIAAVIHDKAARQAVFEAFAKAHPDLKAWEAQALRGRAFCIANAAQRAGAVKPSHTEWMGEIYNELETLTPCTRSDAQAIADGQQFELARQWGLGSTAKDAAAAILKAATVK